MATFSSLWRVFLRFCGSWRFIGLVRFLRVLLGYLDLALLIHFLSCTAAELEIQDLIEREAFVQIGFAVLLRVGVLV